MQYTYLAFDLLWLLFWKLPFKGTTKMAVAAIIDVLSRARRYTDVSVLRQEVALVRALPSPFVLSAAWHFGATLGGTLGRIFCVGLVLLPNLLLGLLFAGLYWVLCQFDVFSPLLLAAQTTSMAVLAVKALGLFSGKRALPYTLSLGRLMGIIVFAGCPLRYVFLVVPLLVVFFTATSYYLRYESRAVLRTWQVLSGGAFAVGVALLGLRWAVASAFFEPTFFWRNVVLCVLFALVLLGHGVWRLSPGFLFALTIVSAYVLL